MKIPPRIRLIEGKNPHGNNRKARRALASDLRKETGRKFKIAAKDQIKPRTGQ
jgi:hypothetical protein